MLIDKLLSIHWVRYVGTGGLNSCSECLPCPIVAAQRKHRLNKFPDGMIGGIEIGENVSFLSREDIVPVAKIAKVGAGSLGPAGCAFSL
jgi:hypothetical protein